MRSSSSSICRIECLAGGAQNHLWVVSEDSPSCTKVFCQHSNTSVPTSAAARSVVNVRRRDPETSSVCTQLR